MEYLPIPIALSSSTLSSNCNVNECEKLVGFTSTSTSTKDFTPNLSISTKADSKAVTNDLENNVFIADLISIQSDNSTATTSRNTNCTTVNNSNNILLFKFEIPWEKIQSDIISMLQNKQALGHKLNVLANLLIDEMRMISRTISMGAIRIAAKKIAAEFPDSFVDKDEEGNIINLEPICLINAMRNRVNFLNRAPKRIISLAEEVPLKQKKRTLALNASCSNWQPTVSQDQSVTSKSKQEKLKHWYKTDEKNPEILVLIESFMKECFPFQIQFLNNRKEIPTVADVQVNWPYIFFQPYMKNHFEALLNVDSAKLAINFRNSKEKTITFLRSKKLLFEDYNDLNIIQGFFTYFKEDCKLLYQRFKVVIF